MLFRSSQARRRRQRGVATLALVGCSRARLQHRRPTGSISRRHSWCASAQPPPGNRGASPGNPRPHRASRVAIGHRGNRRRRRGYRSRRSPRYYEGHALLFEGMYGASRLAHASNPATTMGEQAVVPAMTSNKSFGTLPLCVRAPNTAVSCKFIAVVLLM